MHDEAKRTTFGSHFGEMRSMQGSHCHVATSPSHDVGVNKCRSQPVTTSQRHHVATSPRRDVTTSRRHHVATSPRRDVTTSRRHHVATSPRRDVTTSRRHHVATSPRRDVTTSRRQLKNLYLIIKCERAREFRASKNVRPEIRNFRTWQHRLQGSPWIFVLVFPYCFDYFLDHMRMFFTLHILFLSFMMF